MSSSSKHHNTKITQRTKDLVSRYNQENYPEWIPNLIFYIICWYYQLPDYWIQRESPYQGYDLEEDDTKITRNNYSRWIFRRIFGSLCIDTHASEYIHTMHRWTIEITQNPSLQPIMERGYFIGLIDQKLPVEDWNNTFYGINRYSEPVYFLRGDDYWRDASKPRIEYDHAQAIKIGDIIIIQLSIQSQTENGLLNIYHNGKMRCYFLVEERHRSFRLFASFCHPGGCIKLRSYEELKYKL